MRSFRFNREQEELRIEEVIKYRKKKLHQQQFVYGTILVFIILLVGVYVYNKVMYTELDGYVKVDVNRQRAVDDIFVKDIYVMTGNFVLPGDTLYSYVYLNSLVGQMDRTREPAILVNNRDMTIKMAQQREEMQVLKVQIAELKKQIALENHNISYGLSSNSHMLDLQRQLKEAEEELRMKQIGLNVISSARNEIKADVDNARNHKTSPLLLQDIMVDTIGRYNSLLQYRVSTDSALVADLNVPDGSTVFRTEEIMSLRPLDLIRTNFMIYAYVASDNISKLKRNKRYVVYFDDDTSVEVELGLIGVRTEELPDHLRSNFADNGRVLIVQFTPKDGQQLPLWAFTEQMPVKIEMTNFSSLGKAESLYETFKVWIMTGSGLRESSKKYLKFNRQQHMEKTKKRLKTRRSHYARPVEEPDSTHTTPHP